MAFDSPSADEQIFLDGLIALPLEDTIGLLWSMKPVNSNSQKRFGYRDDEVNGWTVDFSVTDSAGVFLEPQRTAASFYALQGLSRG